MNELELAQLLRGELLVPIRSSSGEAPDPARVPLEGMRHANDDAGRFLAAFSSQARLLEFGPPGSDAVTLPARELFDRAQAAGERVVIDPHSDAEFEVPATLLPFLAAGIDLASPDALRARRPIGLLPELAAPGEIPQPLGGELHAALETLPQVERAWLLRAADRLTVGVQLSEDADLGAFDAVRNRLHALAQQHLDSHRDLVVTDLRAPAIRDQYDAAAAPFYVRRVARRGLLGKLFGSS